MSDVQDSPSARHAKPDPATDREDELHDIDPAKLEFFDREADHFFRGELAHEQRAAWLLALASVLLVAQWRLISQSSADSMSSLSFGLMIGTTLALIISVALSLWALWPLGGGQNPGLLRPWRARHSLLDPSRPASEGARGWPGLPARYRVSISEMVWHHYIAHRRRAEIKGRRVVLVTIALFGALLLGAAAILSTLVEPVA